MTLTCDPSAGCDFGLKVNICSFSVPPVSSSLPSVIRLIELTGFPPLHCTHSGLLSVWIPVNPHVCLCVVLAVSEESLTYLSLHKLGCFGEFLWLFVFCAENSWGGSRGVFNNITDKQKNAEKRVKRRTVCFHNAAAAAHLKLSAQHLCIPC